MTFGSKMAALRKQRGITQKELAQAIGVSPRTITNYETGGRFPKKKETYQLLADILEVDVNYLYAKNEQFVACVSDTLGEGAEKEAIQLMAEVIGLFTGGNMNLHDHDEMVLAIQDAFFIAYNLIGDDQIGDSNFDG